MPHIGDLVSEMLAQYGVELVFGMPGGQTTALHDGISRRTDRIRHILMRDERNAAYAADAYARLTGKPGISTRKANTAPLSGSRFSASGPSPLRAVVRNRVRRSGPPLITSMASRSNSYS